MPSKVTSKLASSSLHRLFSKRCYVVTHYHADACYNTRVSTTQRNPIDPSVILSHRYQTRSRRNIFIHTLKFIYGFQT